MKITKLILGISLALLITSCGSTKKQVAKEENNSQEVTETSQNSQDGQDMGLDEPINVTFNYVPKKTKLDKKGVEKWAQMDIVADSIPGMSIDKAYKFLVGKKGQRVIVGVIDSGIDIQHEDLKNNIWVNKDEIPNNGKDDDKNGYVDDINGWNFLGGEKGSPAPEQFEKTRIVAKQKKVFSSEKADAMKAESNRKFKAMYDQYIRLEKEVEEEKRGANKYIAYYKEIIQSVKEIDTDIKKTLSKKVYTIDDIVHYKKDDKSKSEGKEMLITFIKDGKTIKEGLDGLQRKLKRKQAEADHYYNIDFKGRVTGDDPDDIKDVPYGNNYIMGSKEDEIHGTHVSGIICAQRFNGKGMNGVAHNVDLMSIRAIPDGDEYDKDVALAIRYAADNGAKVVNMSFIKSYSPHTRWVYEAIKYAETKDVLLVHAAGNDAYNMDMKTVYPTDTDSKNKVIEFADNVITVGAISRNLNQDLVAYFSNYGKNNVDIFAPGVEIYATFPNNQYQSISGTSMAAPQVAGVAALIRSYYPSLTASQVKHIIMDSGISIKRKVKTPGEKGAKRKIVTLDQLSVSGKIVNAYNALLMADKMAKQN